MTVGYHGKLDVDVQREKIRKIVRIYIERVARGWCKQQAVVNERDLSGGISFCQISVTKKLHRSQIPYPRRPGIACQSAGLIGWKRSHEFRREYLEIAKITPKRERSGQLMLGSLTIRSVVRC